jgi:cytochrome c553
MTSMNKTIFAAACAMMLSATPTMAADYEAGKKKAAEVCAACHGEDGTKPLTPETPILAGQYADYLAHSLRAYKKERGKITDGPMAQPLSGRTSATSPSTLQQAGLQSKC